MNTIRLLGTLAVLYTTIPVSSAAEAIAFAASEVPAPGAGPAINYRLAPNDLVTVKVFQEEDLTTAARLAGDGTIAIPLIGQVKMRPRARSRACSMRAFSSTPKSRSQSLVSRSGVSRCSVRS